MTAIYDEMIKPKPDIVISVKSGDYITCPYPATAFIICRLLICMDNLNNYPSRCPSCGRGL